MGTNYYIKENYCKECGRYDRGFHIGKSSGGWCFGLHVIPDERLLSLDEWKDFWDDKEIINEYGEDISREKMLEIITNRSWKGRKYSKQELAINHAENGINGLLRHKIDGNFVIGHGEGTWDLLQGEFS